MYDESLGYRIVDGNYFYSGEEVVAEIIHLYHEARE